MKDVDDYISNYYGWDLNEEGTQEVIEKPIDKQFNIIDVHSLNIKPDEILVIKYDNDMDQNSIEMFAKAVRSFLRKHFGDEMGDRFIMIPKNWDMEKLKVDQGPVTHPLYETKVPSEET